MNEGNQGKIEGNAGNTGNQGGNEGNAGNQGGNKGNGGMVLVMRGIRLGMRGIHEMGLWMWGSRWKCGEWENKGNSGWNE